MLKIEPGDPIPPSPCDHCGCTTTTLVRWVHNETGTVGAYYARYSDNHHEGDIAVAVSLGKWGEGASSADRVAFALVMRPTATGPQVMVVDASQSPWQQASTIGPMLNRAEALAHPRLSEAFSITDHMVVDDPDIRAYIEARSRNA